MLYNVLMANKNTPRKRKPALLGVRMNDDEWADLEYIMVYHDRDRSDMVKFLIRREAARILAEAEKPSVK